jgi:hypothetical protein
VTIDAAIDAWKGAVAWLGGIKQGRGIGSAGAFAAAASGLRIVANTDWQASTFRIMCLILAALGIIQWVLIIFGQLKEPVKKPAAARRSSLGKR